MNGYGAKIMCNRSTYKARCLAYKPSLLVHSAAIKGHAFNHSKGQLEYQRSSASISEQALIKLQRNHYYNLGEIDWRASPAGSHLPQIHEALQRCGLGAAALRCKQVDVINYESCFDAQIELGGATWELRVLDCCPMVKRLNESWDEAQLRHAKHAAAHELMHNRDFLAALEREVASKADERETRAMEARAARRALPTMTDLVLTNYVATGMFEIRYGQLTEESLAPAMGAACIGLDVEGFNIERTDWERASLVQLAFKSPATTIEVSSDMKRTRASGLVLVLFVRFDEEMDMFATWLEQMARNGCTFFLYDHGCDMPGIFRNGLAPSSSMNGKICDLKEFGGSLHALAGQHLFQADVRKHDRLCQSMGYLPDTLGVTDTQIHYAAADAIATLELGLLLKAKQS